MITSQTLGKYFIFAGTTGMHWKKPNIKVVKQSCSMLASLVLRLYDIHKTVLSSSEEGLGMRLYYIGRI